VFIVRIHYYFKTLIVLIKNLKYITFRVRYLHKNEFISNFIRITKTPYQLLELDFVSRNYDITKFVDIGANIGNHSRFFECMGGSGIAIEPSFQNFTFLEKNLKKSLALNFAIGNEEKTVNLITFPKSMGNSFVQNTTSPNLKNFGKNPKSELVQMRTLDSLELPEVSLLKIDAEGSELNILKGALNTINTHLPIIWIEINRSIDQTDYVDIMLKNMGYRLEVKLSMHDYIYRYLGN
jgi:FkbM family methyltransferase